MADAATRQLLDRFVGLLRPVPSLLAVWAHGSLAGGDYRQGRSDLDLIAVLEHRCTPVEEERLVRVHEVLAAETPLASRLHCSYVAADEWDDLARPHLTWAHEELMRRPVTAVTRCELRRFGTVLHGPPPAGLVPPVTDRQLADSVAADLRAYWRPALDHPERWHRDIWVDLGLLTLARAATTLDTGRLITKSEALDVLADLGAPAEVVHDIRQRRYGTPAPTPPEWAARRADLARTFLRSAIDEVLISRQG
ncbi:nucleotidyltransferase domain-containing protein [Streptomyces sp. NRRL B-24484]|uniref:nucleotidyltransferase domain-containing protein n=1 Tax=Streptomyces sp. NRRL B-24484 TaxID=1463833 RepID=UPI0004C0E9CC|nr:nucleotidyltransferase domain-containing protein [Streptomyces sp. NRRL B-24484]